MRPIRYTCESLAELFKRDRVVSLDMAADALGMPSRMTVFRKLAAIGARASYSHRGRYHTLDSIAAYDEHGLWSFEDIRFSLNGTLLDTIVNLVGAAPAGLFASDLREQLKVRVHTALAELYAASRLYREQLEGVYLYLDTVAYEAQLAVREQRLRRSADNLAVAQQPKQCEWNADMAFLLSMLNEKQRRLYLGLESIRAGRGGDVLVSEMTGANIKTIARGRRELQQRSVTAERIRRAGGGRPTKKKSR